MDPLDHSGLQLGSLVATGRVSVTELVERHIALVQRVNPRLNAVVATRFDEARAEARAADETLARRDRSELSPYFGVPCTIKENFALRGMPQTAGLVARRGRLAERDAVTVRRLREAGAIPLGVTNTSELCMWMESDNRVYGRSNNPYDAARIVGGSSGGEGAIVGSGASPFGLGADVGGSIRGPAFFNGVFGHKPTPGIVPNAGQYPLAEGDGLRFLCTGPLCRRAEDLMPLLRALAGADADDPLAETTELGDPARVEWRGRTVLHVEDNGKLPVSDELRAAVEGAARALERHGARIVKTRLPALEQQFDIWSAMMGLVNETPFGTLLGEGRPIRPLHELGLLIRGRSEHTLMALLLAVTEHAPKLLHAQALRLRELSHALGRELGSLMGEHGVWLYPPHTSTAPRHGVPVRQALRLHMPWSYLAIVNVLYLPATAVPLGLGRGRLPLGTQVIGRPGGDHVTVAAALLLEREFGGWVRPPAS